MHIIFHNSPVTELKEKTRKRTLCGRYTLSNLATGSIVKVFKCVGVNQFRIVQNVVA